MMLHPFVHARLAPAKPALTMAGAGETVGYGDLERRANRTARLLRELGIGHGDTVRGDS